MPGKPATVAQYLAGLPAERRRLVEALRETIREHIDPAFEEGLQYGMLGWFLPHARYPAGYHCDPRQPLPFASIASQKNHVGLYLFCIYGNSGEEARFRKEWQAAGKRLDMGKSCVRVKSLDDVPLEVVGRAFERMTARKFVAHYEASLEGTAAGRKHAARRQAAGKTTAKQATRKKATRKKATKATAKQATRKKATKVAAKKAARKKAARKPAAKATAKKATRKKAAKVTAKRTARGPAAKTTAKKGTRKKATKVAARKAARKRAR